MVRGPEVTGETLGEIEVGGVEEWKGMGPALSLST